MAWRLALALAQLREELDAAAPARSRASDGTIGDAAHASRDSDHNPWVTDRGVGVVTAIDLTDDDAHGADMAKLADHLLRKRDPRIKYLIHNARIASSYPTSSTPAWTWRPYSGVNAHRKHLHVSVQPEHALYDSRAGWDVKAALRPPIRGHAPSTRVPPFPLAAGRYFGEQDGEGGAVSGFEVGGHLGLQMWQRQMRRRGWDIAADGLYGKQTGDVAEAFQRQKHLTVDRRVGPQTWAAAWSAPVTKD